MLDSLTQEIVHSAKIEGEELNRDSVRSSVARQPWGMRRCITRHRRARMFP